MTLGLTKREIAIVAITKNGIEIAKKLKSEFITAIFRGYICPFKVSQY